MKGRVMRGKGGNDDNGEGIGDECGNDDEAKV